MKNKEHKYENLELNKKLESCLKCLEIIQEQEKIINSLGYKIKIIIKEKH